MAVNIKKYLNSIGVRPNKKLGQNFLIDPSAIEEIVQFGAPNKSENIIEIGGGTGVLTEYLADYNLTIIEIDENLAPQLEKKFPNATIINEDVRYVDFESLGDKLTIFGNLPYSFSTDIILHVIEYRKNIKRCIFMLQKEFSRRLAGVPGTKAYGTLSINLQIHCDVSLGPVIKGTSFYPTTEVDSQVVELRMHDKPKYEIKDRLVLAEILSLAFSKRRKKISNSLSGYKKMPGEELAKVLEKAGISGDVRPEDISVESYVKLANFLSD